MVASDGARRRPAMHARASAQFRSQPGGRTQRKAEQPDNGSPARRRWTVKRESCVAGPDGAASRRRERGMTVPEISQDMIRAYAEYTHLTLDRRSFMEK